MRAYIIHPYETYGTIEENLKLEETFYEFLKAYDPAMTYIRPFKLIRPNVERERAMKECLKLLDSCSFAFAAPGWHRSEGCREEVKFAVENGIEVIEVAGLPFTKKDLKELEENE